SCSCAFASSSFSRSVAGADGKWLVSCIATLPTPSPVGSSSLDADQVRDREGTWRAGLRGFSRRGQIAANYRDRMLGAPGLEAHDRQLLRQGRDWLGN